MHVTNALIVMELSLQAINVIVMTVYFSAQSVEKQRVDKTLTKSFSDLSEDEQKTVLEWYDAGLFKHEIRNGAWVLALDNVKINDLGWKGIYLSEE